MELDKVIIWGTGNTTNRVLNNISGLLNHIACFIDKYSIGKELFGLPVYTPDYLLQSYNNETIVIFSQIYYEEIKKEALSFEIPESNIIHMNDWVSKLLQNDDNVLLKPQEIRIEASSLCQLNCETCYMRMNDSGNVGKGWLKAKDYKTLIDENSWVRSVELSNNGEVFLNPELVEILQNSYNKVDIYINNGTNFNSLSDEQAEALVKYQVKSILVSVDGASQSIYEKYRRNGDFDKVISNIRLVNYYKDLYKSEYPKLKWQYVLMSHNECDISHAIELAKELNMQIEFKLDWCGEYTPQDPKRVTELTGYEVFNRKAWKEKYGYEYVQGACFQMLYAPQINWDGKLLGCCGNYLSDWGCNVFENGLLNSLNETNYRTAIAGFLVGKHSPELADICQKCNGNVKFREVKLVL